MCAMAAAISIKPACESSLAWCVMLKLEATTCLRNCRSGWSMGVWCSQELSAMLSGPA